MTTAFDYGFFSADSHVTEPPDCYARFIDPAFRDRAPHIVRDEKRGDLYVIPGLDKMSVPMGLVAAAGEESGKMSFSGRNFEDWHRSGWDPAHRCADQARDGIAGELLFASVGMPLAGHPDLDYRRACMVAYNRWLQEYCAHDPARLFGAAQAAIKNADEGAAELRLIKEQGFPAVMMSGIPGEADYDHPQYDKLWATAVELGLPLCFHILTNTSYGGHRGPKINALLNVIRSVQDIVGMLIYSGVFDRFPALKVVCVEADAGWVPHYTYRMDHIYNRHRFWNKAPALTRLPSEYFFDNVYMTFQDDWTALKMLDQLNPQRLLWANDFPHSDSTWPLSESLVAEHFAGVDPQVARRILRDNATELFGITAPEQPPTTH
ncbi:MAG: amidohydrolase [Myxococcales bacterium]|nr:amidohydrolase [Myxococcales bacterium]MCB9630212.1 amidohydrolase [Sandaracinaceae bacterium]